MIDIYTCVLLAAFLAEASAPLAPAASAQQLGLEAELLGADGKPVRD